MLRRALSIVAAAAAVLLTVAIGATPLAQAPPRATAPATLDEKLSAAVTRGDVPGIVAVAASRDPILYQGVFGKADVAGGRPMTADALFRIASMTKAVTSDTKALTIYDTFERAVYQLADASLKSSR